MLDDDGYPDEKSLNLLAEFDSLKKPIDGIEPIDEYLELIRDNWWAEDWGYKIIKIKGRRFLELHTGGWSGNEDVIRAIRKNIFWYRLEVERVGGHYLFEVDRVKAVEDDSIPWKDMTHLCKHCKGWGLV